MAPPKKVTLTMPPKKAAAQAASEPEVTVDSIYEAGERLASSENENDFKFLLNAFKAGPKEKVAGIQFLARYADKFPKHAKAVMAAVKGAAGDADEQVRTTVYRELGKFTQLDRPQVTEILFSGMGDSDEKVLSIVRNQLKKLFDEGGEEFQTELFGNIQTMKDEAQARLVDFIRENVQFTEESASKVVPVLAAAFKTNVKEGLLLFRKTHKLLKEEEWKPLIDDLIGRFDRSLDKQFDQVIEHLLIPLLDNTRCMGEEARTKLVASIGTKVLAKWSELPDPQKLGILQRLAELARDCEEPQVVENLYKNVFLTADTVKINFSIVEALLFAFLRLAKKFPKAASQQIGVVLVMTGQPNEAEGVPESDELHDQFKSKIEAIKAVCDPFIDQCEAKIKAAKEEKTEEGKTRMFEALKARKVGGNTRKLCSLLLRAAPLQGKVPSTPSWVFVKNKGKKQGKGDRKFGDKKKFGDRKFGDRRKPNNRRPFRK